MAWYGMVWYGKVRYDKVWYGRVGGHKSDLLPDQMDKKREMSAMYRGRIERLRLSEESIEFVRRI